MAELDERKGLFPLELEAVARSGPEGSRWVQAFRGAQSWRRLEEAVRARRLLRGYSIDAGVEALDQVGVYLAAPRETDAASRIARRWYLSARAYQAYLDGDLDAAERRMDEARQEAVAALSLHPFLVPFATQFTDFEIQKARIARHRNRWDAVRCLLTRIRRMFAGEDPLCVRADGSPWSMHDVRAFYAEVLPDDDRKEKLLANLGHPAAMDRLEEGIYTLPDFVIPYP